MFLGTKKICPRDWRPFLGKGAGQDKNRGRRKIFCPGVSGQPPKMWYAEKRRAQGVVLLGANPLLTDQLQELSTDSLPLQRSDQKKEK